MHQVATFLRWIGRTVMKVGAHAGANTSTPHDAEMYRPRPPEYRP